MGEYLERRNNIGAMVEILKLSQLDEETLDLIENSFKNLTGNPDLNLIQDIEKLVLQRFSEILYPDSEEKKNKAAFLSKTKKKLNEKLAKYFSDYLEAKLTENTPEPNYNSIEKEIEIILNVFSISLNEYVKHFIWDLLYDNRIYNILEPYNGEDFVDFLKSLFIRIQ